MAYSALLKKFHPEDASEGFQTLRYAYESAVSASKQILKDDEPEVSSKNEVDKSFEKTFMPPFDPVPPQPAPSKEQSPEAPRVSTKDAVKSCLEKVIEIFSDTARRKTLSCWQSFLEQELLCNIEVKQILRVHLFKFISEHPFVPGEVLGLFNDYFDWTKRPEILYANLPEELIHNTFDLINNRRWLVSHATVPPMEPERYDNYILLRQNASDAIKNGDFKQALESVQAATDIYAEDPELYRLLASIYSFMGDDRACLKACEMLLQLTPFEPDGYLLQTEIFLRTGQPDRAVATCQKLLEYNPDNMDAISGMARGYIQLHLYEEAQILLENVIQICPDHAAAHMDLLLVHRRLISRLQEKISANKNDKKLQLKLLNLYLVLDMHTELQTMANNLVLSSTKLSDKDLASFIYDVYFILARSCHQQKKYKDAIKYFDTMEDIATRFGYNQYELYKGRGISKQYDREYSKSIFDLKNAIKIHPNRFDSDLLYNLGRSLQTRGKKSDKEKALKIFNRLINNAEPHNVNYLHYVQRGDLNYDLKNYQQSLDDYFQAQHLNVNYTHHYKLAIAYIGLENYEEALDRLKKAEEEGLGIENIYYQLARCFYGMENYEAARQAIEKCLEINDDDHWKQWVAGYIYWKLNAIPQAIQSFLNAFHLTEDSAFGGDQVFYFLLKTRQYHLADKLLNNGYLAEGDDSTDLDILLKRADAFNAMGNWKKGQTYIERYFSELALHKQKPDNPVAYYLRARLGILSKNMNRQDAFQILLFALKNFRTLEMCGFFYAFLVDSGRMQEAESFLNKIITHYPEYQVLTQFSELLPCDQPETFLTEKKNAYLSPLGTYVTKVHNDPCFFLAVEKRSDMIKDASALFQC
jgi:tetratricopeptide (TPR) repeat protein